MDDPAQACITVHGTAICWAGAAVLLRGSPGTGKSDLALRCMFGAPSSAALIADDQVCLTRDRGTIIARAPDVLKGLLEVRGIGIIDVPSVEAAPLCLVVDLVAAHTVERMPASNQTTLILGCHVPHLALAPFEASTPLKISLALQRAQALSG